ncbi:MAG: hypothetical protein WBG86_10940, partial [Polyangiales bacterium]
ITVIDNALNVDPRHLNKHIDYLATPQPDSVKDRSLSTPLGMALSSDGSTLYVAGFGSSAVGVYDTAQLENDTFVPDASNMIAVDGGPSGLVLDEANERLYVLTRFGNDIIVVDTNTREVVTLRSLHSPEPSSVTEGRPFLYEAKLTGSNGEAACSSCHMFGDMDDLAWDLGDPDGVPVTNPNPSPDGASEALQPFDPLKGPMTTQSLRGLSTAGPMHWRGDRTGGPLGDPLDENAAFNAFNVAFPGLIGRDEGELDTEDMQSFTDFALQLTYPPNPIRNLDNSLRPDEQAGLNLFFGRNTDGGRNCNGCHETDPSQGFFGTGGGSTVEGETMEFKVSHLRNMYQKVGMFGMPPLDLVDANGAFTGDQVRGFGYLHDGSIDTVFRFVSAGVFSIDDTEQSNLEAFMMAFDSDLAPIVGQQVTLTSSSGASQNQRVDLLIERAGAPFETPDGTFTECELTVKGVVDGERRGWLRQADGTFASDKVEDGSISETDLRGLAAVSGQELTFTCVPPGSGTRMGINRDGDTLLDGDDPFPYLNPSGCSASNATSEGAQTVAWLLALLGAWLLRRPRTRAGQGA